MIRRVMAIAVNTFREAIRSKVLYGIVLAVVVLNLFALVLGQMSLGEEVRVARDVGMAGVSLFGSATAIVLGVSLLYGEVQRKTIHSIISKPIARHEFVLGKYLGMAVTLTLLVTLFALALAGLLFLVGRAGPPPRLGFDATMAKAVFLGYLEVLVVAAIAVFFSSFSTPYLSGLFTFAIFFIGRASTEVRLATIAAKDAWIRTVARLALYVTPDLHLYSPSGAEANGRYVSIHAGFVGWDYVGVAAAYALAWVALLLVASGLIFRRRDFA